MIHKALPRFWKLYDALPESVQDLADKNFALVNEIEPASPVTQFQKDS